LWAFAAWAHNDEQCALVSGDLVRENGYGPHHQTGSVPLFRGNIAGEAAPAFPTADGRDNIAAD
jgi:hypothetical protein